MVVLSSTRNNLFDKLDALVLCLQHKFQVQGAATLVDEALLTVVTLLEEMRQKGPEPNVITCNAAISACEKGKQPDKALELLEETQQKGPEHLEETWRKGRHLRWNAVFLFIVEIADPHAALSASPAENEGELRYLNSHAYTCTQCSANHLLTRTLGPMRPKSAFRDCFPRKQSRKPYFNIHEPVHARMGPWHIPGVNVKTLAQGVHS